MILINRLVSLKGGKACDIDWSFPLYKDGSLMLLNSEPIDILQAFDGIFYHP